FLIANLVVLGLVLVANYVFNINFLNRLTFNISLFTEGILALNSPPINPPTYFIRDIFVIFVLIEFVRNRNLYMLLIIIPLLIFGKLLLRYDILVLFLIGIAIGKFEFRILEPKIKQVIMVLLSAISLVFVFKADVAVYKYTVALLILILIIGLKIKFYNVGPYSYLLHLYHSPIIVCSYPLIKNVSDNELLLILLQIIIAFTCTYLLYKLTRKIPQLRI